MSRQKAALRVDDLMSREVVALAPELPLKQAVAILAEHHIGGAPVVVGSALLGVFSASDLLGFHVDTPAVPADLPEIRDRAPVRSTVRPRSQGSGVHQGVPARRSRERRPVHACRHVDRVGHGPPGRR